jgi:hypothetical protein
MPRRGRILDIPHPTPARFPLAARASFCPLWLRAGAAVAFPGPTLCLGIPRPVGGV